MSIEQAVSREILSALAGNPKGMRRRELFPLCDSAGEPIEVSNALRELIKEGLIEVVVERNGNQGPAYARTNADAVEQEIVELIHADPVLLNEPVNENPVLDLDTDPDPDHFDLIIKSLVAIKAQAKPVRVIDDMDLKLQCLNRLQSLLNPDVAEILSAIAVDLEATY